MRRQKKEAIINHVSLLNISVRTHIHPEKTEKQGHWDGGEREEVQSSFAVLDICVAQKACRVISLL